MCSTFISLNGNALTGPRAYFAMARDGLLPARLWPGPPAVPDARRTPCSSQGIWAILLTIAGTALILVPPPERRTAACPAPSSTPGRKLNKTPLYDLLYTYVIFGANVFYLLAIASVFVLRAKLPDLPRPYRTWGYPFTPLLYVVGRRPAAGQHAAELREPRAVRWPAWA